MSKTNLPLRTKFENEVWSQTELDLGNLVSDEMNVVHLDRQLLLNPYC